MIACLQVYFLETTQHKVQEPVLLGDSALDQRGTI